MRAPFSQRSLERVERRIVIERDGSVTVLSGKVEYGQGIRTGFARMVAEELQVPAERVNVVLGETDRVPWDLGTFGSMSMAVDGQSLRAAVVEARRILLDRASSRFGVAPARLSLRNGKVVAPDGRMLSFEELTKDEPVAGNVPEIAAAANVRAAHGEDIPLRLEAVDIVTGRANYPADVRLPGMLRGLVLHSQRHGERLVSVDIEAARAVPGLVAVVQEDGFLGVVAESGEALVGAARALRPQWQPADQAAPAIYDSFLRHDKGVNAVFSHPATRVRAAYHLPHIAHGSILPRSAVADVRDDGADLYVATQRPFGLRDEAAALLGMEADQVHVHPQMMGGMYGRGNVEDVSLEAVRLSKAAGRPVLVQWSRGEEFRLSPHRPAFDAQIEASLDDTGMIIGWRQTIRTNPYIRGPRGTAPRMMEQSAGRNGIPPYRLGAAAIALHVEDAAIPTMSFRSLGAAPNVFASESFMDELAHHSGQDPVAFRLRHLEDPRLRRVVETVRDRSGWRRPRAAGRGLGLACAIYHDTYVAEIAEVVADPKGAVRLERVWCAVDGGRLVHPDGARNQIEGGIQQAASWALMEELGLQDGLVQTASWRDYPVATFAHAPSDIDVVFVGDADVASTGMGEPGSVPTAAAIANAIFDASGTRVRRLPVARMRPVSKAGTGEDV